MANGENDESLSDPVRSSGAKNTLLSNTVSKCSATVALTLRASSFAA